MAEKERYSMRIGDIGQQELDLLECLIRIDSGAPLDDRAGALLQRLVDAGLVDSHGGELALTTAGIERSRSLQHRLAGDKDAARVLVDRGRGSAADG